MIKKYKKKNDIARRYIDCVTGEVHVLIAFFQGQGSRDNSVCQGRGSESHFKSFYYDNLIQFEISSWGVGWLQTLILLNLIDACNVYFAMHLLSTK